MDLSDQDVKDLRELEEGLWRAEVRFSRPAMEQIVAPDFFEFGRSGRTYSRADTLDISSREINAVLPLPDFKARLLAVDVAQVTYISIVRYPEGVERARRSSIWTRKEASWQLRFHQGTAIPDEIWEG
jgi:hypothetical protein